MGARVDAVVVSAADHLRVDVLVNLLEEVLAEEDLLVEALLAYAVRAGRGPGARELLLALGAVLGAVLLRGLRLGRLVVEVAEHEVVRARRAVGVGRCDLWDGRGIDY